MRTLFLAVFCTVLFISPAVKGYGEFYEYIDKNGVKTYSDKPPRTKKKDVQVHKGRYDDLTVEERKERMLADEERHIELKKKQEANRKYFEEFTKKRDMKKAKIHREKNGTPVTIKNNQILVPVTIGYKEQTVKTTLLLDTGASITSIHDSVGNRLGIKSDRGGMVEVAGGGKIPAKRLKVKFIKVGPKVLPTPYMVVMDYIGKEESFNGLLGLDFLKNFKYEIDYENSLLMWKE